MKRIWMMIVAVALALGSFTACSRTEQKHAGPPERVTIAIATLPETTLAQAAQSQGYYREEGLDASVHLHPYGKMALDELLEGKADFATVAETPVMFSIMKGERISVIATILTSNLGHVIVARRDRGIASFEDLKGKRIAATLGTTSQFFLDTFLVTHGISRKDVELVDLKAEQIPDALTRGDIDAASTFAPFNFITQKQLGNNAVIFQSKDIYKYYFNIVATQEFIRKNPKKVDKLLRALLRAEEFVNENPTEAQAVIAGFSRIDKAIITKMWDVEHFSVTLDQSLLLALEEESRWAIKNKLTTATKVPNYLDYIYRDGLLSIAPKTVRVLK